MGHHMSKQQHQQLLDDDQESATSSNTPKQQKTLVKSATNLLFPSKNSRSKAKKSKRSSATAETVATTEPEASTSSQKATKSTAKTIQQNKSDAATATKPAHVNAVSTAITIPKTSESIANNPDSSSGPVVITIRLMKMEANERPSGDASSPEFGNRVSIHSVDHGTVVCICGRCTQSDKPIKCQPTTSSGYVNDRNSEQLNESLSSMDLGTAKVVPTQLIGEVSPYPRHIPFGNYLLAESSTETPSIDHDQHSNSNKDTKTKRQNWGIKFCPKLKGMKSSPNTSTPSSSALVSSSSTSAPSASISTSTSSSSTPPAQSEPSSPGVSHSNATNIYDGVPSESSETSDTNVSACSSSSQQSATLLLDQSTFLSAGGANVLVVTMDQRQSLLELARYSSSDEYQIEDCDKQARLQRAIDIDEGVEAPPGFISTSSLQSLHSMSSSNLQLVPNDALLANNGVSGVTLRFMLPQLVDSMPRVHSQVDYMHCLVPDLMQITNCSFYWGKMDRYEAERLLENKPEGTFLLRDSAQEEFLFSVSFRKYGRSLHARIEQFNNEFSFDCHDPGVFTSKTVTGLLEHYKDPACVMFFEPALTLPLNRNSVFSLQQLCRATIVSHTTYDGINEIGLPKKLKSYLKEYHYKQRVRLRRYDEIYGTT